MILYDPLYRSKGCCCILVLNSSRLSALTKRKQIFPTLYLPAIVVRGRVDSLLVSVCYSFAEADILLVIRHFSRMAHSKLTSKMDRLF
jgi:hypothetical protein